MYITDSLSSSSEGDEGNQDIPVNKKLMYEPVQEDNSDSDTDAVDSSDSDSASSSSSSEDETVIETKKHKIKAKHSVDKKHHRKHGVKHKYEEQIIGEVHELKKPKSDMQKKGKTGEAVQSMQLASTLDTKKPSPASTMGSATEAADTGTVSKGDFNSLLEFVRSVKFVKCELILSAFYL